jgi:hypothetical protein
MSRIEVILRLSALTVLCGYLLVRHRQRVRKRPKPAPVPPWTPAALDASQLRQRVEHVRRDYLGVRLHPLPNHTRCRVGLVAAAGRVLRLLPYFRDRETEHEAHSHTS